MAFAKLSGKGGAALGCDRRLMSVSALARISHTFRHEAQREPCSGSRSAAETDSDEGTARQGAASINEGADFGGGLCEYTMPIAKIKPDAANAWLPRAAADKCEKSGLGYSALQEPSA
jgi:hypothetical protein